jgi:NAD(P)-dependent dehydrogenase (short-subunit alcohol dehydrogenase family)
MVSHYSGIAGKRVLVTGATSGLGLAMAQALLQEGAKVAIGGRDQDKIDRVVASLGSAAGDCVGALINVRDEQSIEKGVAAMVRLWGGIDVLINNAGIGMRTVNPGFVTDPRPFWEVSAAGFRDLIDTNLTGYFLVAKAVVPHLLRANSGRIINISVSDATMKRKGMIPYGPSRAGAESLSHIMAQDLAERGVTVNLLLPGGATETGMLPEEFRVDPEQWRVKFGVQLLRPDVMAEPTLFLCSDEAKDVHDERIVAKDFQQWKAHWLDRARA